jgi:hypothetical protein
MKIEASPSGRAACRGCKKPIPKGDLRFAESYVVPGTDSMGNRYWHLLCAAEKVAGHLKPVLETYTDPIPERAALEAAMSKSASKGDLPLPHVDRAPTSRAKCIVCDAPIEKGSFRIAVERQVDTGTFVTRGPGYFHPACAASWTEENLEGDDAVAAWKAAVLKNSGIREPELAEVTKLLEAE